MSTEAQFVTQDDLEAPDLYLNRELSLLQFQWRVFDEARDRDNPLLERVKFLAIVASNMSEFFMVRVGGLRMQRDAGLSASSPDGRSPATVLAEIRRESRKLMEEAESYLLQTLIPELRKAGIYVLNYSDLTPRQKENLREYFDEVIYPVLTPLAYDPGHPFPHISNLSLNLAILLRGSDGSRRFARVKVPPSLPQLLPLKRSSGSTRKDGTTPKRHYFVWLDQVITANLDHLFPGLEILTAHPFHVTRNSDMEIQELEALDLLDSIEESVRKRRFGAVVRLMISKAMPADLRKIVTDNMRVDANDIYALQGPLDHSSLMELTRIDRPDLKYKPFQASIPSAIKALDDEEENRGAFFRLIDQQNLLLHHPYDSFRPVVQFLRTAAQDPSVLAIKQTLYRVGQNSPVVNTLLEASRDYKVQVAVLVELKARFDEESNIGWARLLEQEGVHVSYGMVGLKTHSKIALVVRKEGDHIRRYLHLGTGNYNHITANIYEDMGMFTSDPDMGADATDLFNYLTGYSSRSEYRKLLVAPINLRQRFEELIRAEIARAQQGEKAYLLFKMNALVDKPIIKLLYEASRAGVKVDLIVRGICCLRPGLPGISENIRVVSIVGRFLEHSRIYYFYNGGQEVIYMGSADLMPRNLNVRVEVLFPIEDQSMIRHLKDDILDLYLRDNTKARLMLPDGHYQHLHPEKAEKAINVQAMLIARAKS